MVELAVSSYAQLLEICIPVAVVFALGDLLVQTFLRTAFGGKLWIGK